MKVLCSPRRSAAGLCCQCWLCVAEVTCAWTLLYACKMCEFVIHGTAVILVLVHFAVLQGLLEPSNYVVLYWWSGSRDYGCMRRLCHQSAVLLQADVKGSLQAVRLSAVHEDGSSGYLALDILTNSEVPSSRVHLTLCSIVGPKLGYLNSCGMHISHRVALFTCKVGLRNACWMFTSSTSISKTLLQLVQPEGSGFVAWLPDAADVLPGGTGQRLEQGRGDMCMQLVVAAVSLRISLRCRSHSYGLSDDATHRGAQHQGRRHQMPSIKVW